MNNVAILLLLALPFVVLCQTTGSVMQLARQDPDLTQFVAFVDRLGIAAALEGPGPFTVFAPINTAFDSFTTLGKDNAELIDLLLLHVHTGSKIPRNQVGTGGLVMSNGIQMPVIGKSNSGTFIDNVLTIGSAETNVGRVRGPSLDATNGIVHKINRVLIPPVRRPNPPRDDTPPPTTKSSKSTKGTKSAKSKGTKSAKSKGTKSAKSKGTKGAKTAGRIRRRD